MVIITGYWNVKVGCQYKTWRNVIGRYGLSEENERGERLLNFCSVNNLVITNTLFEKKTSKRWTWQGPDGIAKKLDRLYNSK